MRLRLLLILAIVLGAVIAGRGSIRLWRTTLPQPRLRRARSSAGWRLTRSPQPKLRLRDTYSGGAGPRNALTHLALQFWTPTPSGDSGGALQRVTATITNQTINWFVTWGHNNGIKVLLCVYNGEIWLGLVADPGQHQARRTVTPSSTPSSPRCRRSTSTASTSISRAPATNTRRTRPPTSPSSGSSHGAFICSDKIVTVDSFPAQWNAPNWNWWAALFPLCRRHQLDGLRGTRSQRRRAGRGIRRRSRKAGALCGQAADRASVLSRRPGWGTPPWSR